MTTILFLGDTSFGENYMPDSGGVLTAHGYDYPLTRFRDIMRSANVVIANLETPVTDRTDSPFTGKKEYVHWSRSDRAPQVLAAHNISAVSLANNHMLDFGTGGLADTQAHLAASRIRSFGAGATAQEAVQPLRLSLHADEAPSLAVFGGFEHFGAYENVYHFYADEDRPGVLNLSDPLLTEHVEALQKQSEDMFVIAFPHWGEDYQWESGEQRRIARELIAAGTDLVIGHGAHQLQGIENIGGKWVIYGLGNFVFNSQGRYAKEDAPPFSLIAALVVGEEGEKVLRLYPIHTDNLVNGYQGYFVTDEQFITVHGLLMQHTPTFIDEAGVVKDEYGWFFELLL